ncbi:MAG TPA: inositol monophosphatase family protein, partial [Phenylobacterium sp.]|nr:inositol monophosphatase family protein [Phenylobacterium sp.]
VTYNPVTNELFWAEKGKGAFVNDRRLRVAARTRMDEAVFATGIPFLGHGQHATFLKELHQVSQRVAGVRRFGSAALDMAWVAAGRYDGFWERDLQDWDFGAGILLVTEAGGRVTNADGGDEILGGGSVCAGNLDLQPQLLERLRIARG